MKFLITNITNGTKYLNFVCTTAANRYLYMYFYIYSVLVLKNKHGDPLLQAQRAHSRPMATPKNC